MRTLSGFAVCLMVLLVPTLASAQATIAGTVRTLTATNDAELVVLPNFTGGPEQLWRFDELADGSWRIMPKAIPNLKPLALSAVGSSFATFAGFDPRTEKQRWLLKTP